MSSTTRESLIQVARTLFGRYGFKGVSVRQICDAANCNQASISYYFQGKDELYRQCLLDGTEKDIEKFRGILTPAKNREDMEAKMGLFVQQFYDHLVGQSDVVRIITHELTDPSPVGQDIIENLTSELPDLLENFLKDAAQKGIVKSDVDVKNLNGFICSQAITHILFEGKVCQKDGPEFMISKPDARKRLVDQIMLILSGGIYV